MPRDVSGTYTLPEAAFVPATVALSAKVNNNFSDIATALTGSLPRTETTAFSRSLLDDPDATTARATLGFFEQRGSVVASGSLNLTFPAGFSLFRLTIWRLSVSVDAQILARCLVAGVPDTGASDYTYVVSGGESTTTIQQSAAATFIDLTGTIEATTNASRIFVDAIDPGSASHAFQIGAKFGGISSTPTDRNLIVSGRRVSNGAKTGIGLLPSAGTFSFEYLFEGVG